LPHHVYIVVLLRQPFNSLFSTRKAKPFWILMKQEMMRWQ